MSDSFGTRKAMMCEHGINTADFCAACDRIPLDDGNRTTSGSEEIAFTLEKEIEKARAILVASDSLLSLIFHRYRSFLPDDLARDVEQTYWDARKASESLREAQEAFGFDGLPGVDDDD